MSKSGVYLIEIGNKIYIGSSKNLNKRRGRHLSDLNRGIHSNIYLQRAFDKYLDFEFSILMDCKEEYLLKYEQKLIDCLKPDCNMLNCWTKEDSIQKQRGRKVHTLYHKEGLIITGNNQKIIKETGLKPYELSSLVNKRNIFRKGWTAYNLSKALSLVKKGDKSKGRNQKGKNNNNYNPTLYTFFHRGRRIKRTCTMNELCRKHGLNPQNVNKLAKGKIKSCKNWVLLNDN